jgi:hypothetical protein
VFAGVSSVFGDGEGLFDGGEVVGGWGVVGEGGGVSESMSGRLGSALFAWGGGL